MKFKISEDKKFLILIDSSQLELEQLEYSLTKKVDNWFILKHKNPNMTWNGEVRFMDNYNRIPIGLWKEVDRLCKQHYFSLEIENIDYILNPGFSSEDFNNWHTEYFKNSSKQPRYYQIEAANKILKYRFCTEEISTSGGKTLISFMIFKYLFNKGIINKMLYVVPNINLVTQTEEKFYEYEDDCGQRPNWKSNCVFGGSKNKEDLNSNITFGTYQSLVKQDLDYFKEFNAVCIDECHHAQNSSLKNIIIKCYNAVYKFGLTGTLPKEGSCSSLTIQSYLGPKVYSLESRKLIDEKNATPVFVYGIELDYLKDDVKKKLFELRSVPTEQKDGAKLLNLEKDLARESRERLNYIVNMIAKCTKNSLVLFSDIKNDYGRKIYDWIRENTEKTAYYVDGGTDSKNRDYYKQQMEDEENVILVASVGTFSEGIDILNLHTIFIVESHKSERIVAQILGRGMRLMDGKEKITVIDFRDNYEYGSGYQRYNYLMRHGNERDKIYKQRKFPFKNFKVKL